MAEREVQRRLAAILAADGAGYGAYSTPGNQSAIFGNRIRSRINTMWATKKGAIPRNTVPSSISGS
jgi:hypothetical protein